MSQCGLHNTSPGCKGCMGGYGFSAPVYSGRRAPSSNLTALSQHECSEFWCILHVRGVALDGNCYDAHVRHHAQEKHWLGRPADGCPRLVFQAALKFLDAKLTVPPRPEGPQASRVPLSAESRAILLRVLAGAAPSLAPEVAAEVARLTAIAQGVPIPGIPAAVAAQQLLFPQDVEEEANDNFQKVLASEPLSLSGPALRPSRSALQCQQRHALVMMRSVEVLTQASHSYLASAHRIDW